MVVQYTPVDGLKNDVTFVDAPLTPADARKQFQDMLDQMLAFHNTHLGEAVTDVAGVHGLIIKRGTWTPALAGNSVAGTNTYSYQVGSYYQIDNLMICTGKITLTHLDGGLTGQIIITGLPVISRNITNISWTGNIGYYENFTSLSNSINYEIKKANTIASLYVPDVNKVEVITHANLTDTTTLRFTLIYEV